MLLAAGNVLGLLALVAQTAPPSRQRYAARTLRIARRRLEKFYRHFADSRMRECQRLARTIRSWEAEVLAYHQTGASNGVTEGIKPVDQEDQARRSRLPQLRQLPAPTVALRCRMAHSPNRKSARPPTTLGRVEPGITGRSSPESSQPPLTNLVNDRG